MDDVEENKTQEHGEGVEAPHVDFVCEDRVVGVGAGDELDEPEDDADLVPVRFGFCRGNTLKLTVMSTKLAMSTKISHLVSLTGRSVLPFSPSSRKNWTVRTLNAKIMACCTEMPAM